jgi:hypothetical protein
MCPGLSIHSILADEIEQESLIDHSPYTAALKVFGISYVTGSEAILRSRGFSEDGNGDRIWMMGDEGFQLGDQQIIMFRKYVQLLSLCCD